MVFRTALEIESGSHQEWIESNEVKGFASPSFLILCTIIYELRMKPLKDRVESNR